MDLKTSTEVKNKLMLKGFTNNCVIQTDEVFKVRTEKGMTKEKGITLVALVITIVILIILATVAISVVFGEGGLIDRAEQGKDLYEQAQKQEQQELLNTEAHLNELLAGTGGSTPTPEPEEPYVDESIVVAPQISEGMTQVKWNGSNWVKTDDKDSSWYNYGEKKWANVVLGDATFTKSGEQEILDESKTYSMLVWIPRYAYKIKSQYHQNGSTAGEIDIVFIDTANKGKDGKVTYKTTYPSATEGANGAMSDFVVHPAFDYGGTALPGFWVGKFESSNTAGYGDSSNANTTNLTLQIKAGVESWRSIQVTNIFTVCTEMNKSGKPYGLNTSDEKVDPHMMKNSEWGAVAYLSQNEKYGKGSEVWINPNSNHITGQAGSSVSAGSTTSTNNYKTGNGPQASTTGNTTGVYDMSGGSWEYVAGYINNSYVQSGQNPYTYGKNLIDAVNEGKTKYADVYKVTTDSQQNNYNNAKPTTGQGTPTRDTGHYGDAVWETSNNYSGTNSWYSDYSHLPGASTPFFDRGGGCSDDTGAGVFYFSNSSGYNDSYNSFRVVVPVL